jgi:hypothetical protein
MSGGIEQEEGVPAIDRRCGLSEALLEIFLKSLWIMSVKLRSSKELQEHELTVGSISGNRSLWFIPLGRQNRPVPCIPLTKNQKSTGKEL